MLGGIDHVANRDRVAGAREAADRGADAVILDDGFQHRRLARTLDIVAFDATDPFGGGRLFPRGFLREPLESLSRAQAVVVTRAATVDAERRADIRRCLERACRGRTPAIWAEADHTAMRLRCWDGSERPLSDLAGKRLMACAAIGNPSAFRDTLAALGAEVVGFRVYPDHHRYGATDLDQLSADAATARADVVISTVKDLVKIRESSLTGLPLMALEIEMTITQGRDQLEQAILGAVGAQQAIPRTASAGG